MTRRTLAVLLVALAALGAACVNVPASVRAQFAPAGPNERSNYRQGEHGTAPPIDDDPKPVVTIDAGTEAGPEAGTT